MHLRECDRLSLPVVESACTCVCVCVCVFQRLHQHPTVVGALDLLSKHYERIVSSDVCFFMCSCVCVCLRVCQDKYAGQTTCSSLMCVFMCMCVCRGSTNGVTTYLSVYPIHLARLVMGQQRQENEFCVF